MAVGTAESARNVLGGTGDFGGGDAPIPEAQLRAAQKSVLELPSVLIGIVVIYELPDVKGELKLTGPVVVNIFLGKIKFWNDPVIAKLNPEMNLRLFRFRSSIEMVARARITFSPTISPKLVRNFLPSPAAATRQNGRWARVFSVRRTWWPSCEPPRVRSDIPS